MELASFFFYIFSTVLVLSAIMVISCRNPVHSVLFLILALFNAAGLFVLLGAEFLAMLLVIVYVGAVAVLFLFVVMMLDVDFVELKQGFLQYVPLGGIVALILAIELIIVLGGSIFETSFASGVGAAPIPQASDVSNTEAIGQLLYTRYVYFFQAAGLVLLVAMIGAIVLTLRHKEGVKRQDIAMQNARTREAAIEVVDVEVGKGI